MRSRIPAGIVIRTFVTTGTYVKLPVNRSVFVPPKSSSEEDVDSLNEKTGLDTCFCATMVWNMGDALKSEIVWYAIPMSPSGGKLFT